MRIHIPHYLALTGLELAMSTRLAFNSRRFVFLHPLGTRIVAVHAIPDPQWIFYALPPSCFLGPVSMALHSLGLQVNKDMPIAPSAELAFYGIAILSQGHR